MLCDDPLDKAFRSVGYNTVRFPSTTYRPLLVLESDGRRQVRGIGTLTTELRSSERAPVVDTDQPAPDIGLDSTRTLSGKVGAELLQPVFAALGIEASAAIMLSRTSGMRVVLSGVTRDGLVVGDLARYLEGDVMPGSQHVLDAAVRGRLFIVTSVLKSAALHTVVDASVAREVEASLDLPQAVSLSLSPSLQDASSRSLTFTGRVPLAFAFRAVRLVYSEGAFLDYETANGLAGYELPGQALGAVDDGLLRLDEPMVDFAG